MEFIINNDYMNYIKYNIIFNIVFMIEFQKSKHKSKIFKIFSNYINNNVE